MHIVLCFCFVCHRLTWPMLPVSLDCTFFISPSVFSTVYWYLDNKICLKQHIRSNKNPAYDCIMPKIGNTLNINYRKIKVPGTAYPDWAHCWVCVVIFDHCLSFFIWHLYCQSSSIYDIWLPLWYLQTVFNRYRDQRSGGKPPTLRNWLTHLFTFGRIQYTAVAMCRKSNFVVIGTVCLFVSCTDTPVRW